MLKININSSSHYPVDRKRVREIVKKTLKKQKADDVELSVFFIGDRKMSKLNKKFLNRERTTDVISFPLTDKEEKFKFINSPKEKQVYLGDIFISYLQARKQAMGYNLTVDKEIDKLVEHGVLHLLGFHHSK